MTLCPVALASNLSGRIARRVVAMATQWFLVGVSGLLARRVVYFALDAASGGFKW
ncbi:hypothetical protein ACT31I_002264 [Vibrio cidicii]|nr:hypothetical protein [Vibrio cidicii]